MQKNVDPQRPVKMYVHMLIAFIMFLVSAIYFDAAGGAIIYSLIAIIWSATRREDRYTWKVKLKTIGIYALMFGMIVGMKNFNNHVSYKNANVIIAACEQYKNKTGVYPAKLDDLVPGYLTEIPIARYTMTSSEFRYYQLQEPSGEEDYRLQFIAEAPFARRVYNSKSKNWRSFD